MFTAAPPVNTSVPSEVYIDMSGRNERGPTESDSAQPGEAGPAFEQLRSGLHKYLLRHLRRTEDVEDLAQEVYLRLLRFTDRDKVKSPQAYLFRVAFNVLYEFKLHRNRGRVSFDSDAASLAAEHLPDESVRPDEAYEHAKRESEVKGLIEQLPPMQRLVLLLATRENLSYDEIAGKLGISASTARVHLYRAIGRLKDAVSKEGM